MFVWQLKLKRPSQEMTIIITIGDRTRIDDPIHTLTEPDSRFYFGAIYIRSRARASERERDSFVLYVIPIWFIVIEFLLFASPIRFVFVASGSAIRSTSTAFVFAAIIYPCTQPVQSLPAQPSTVQRTRRIVRLINRLQFISFCFRGRLSIDRNYSFHYYCYSCAACRIPLYGIAKSSAQKNMNWNREMKKWKIEKNGDHHHHQFALVFFFFIFFWVFPFFSFEDLSLIWCLFFFVFIYLLHGVWENRRSSRHRSESKFMI